MTRYVELKALNTDRSYIARKDHITYLIPNAANPASVATVHFLSGNSVEIETGGNFATFLKNLGLESDQD